VNRDSIGFELAITAIKLLNNATALTFAPLRLCARLYESAQVLRTV